MQYNHNHNKYLKEISSLCYKLKTHLGWDAFFDFSPHCNSVCVRVFKGGWVEYQNEYWRGECYLDWDDSDTKLERIIEKLEGYLEQ